MHHVLTRHRLSLSNDGSGVPALNFGDKIDISRLKNFATNELRAGSVLREVLMTEESEISVNTFLTRLPLYLRLSRLEEKGRGFG
jgi:hypothetical protein